jgi:hypothetical protein
MYFGRRHATLGGIASVIAAPLMATLPAAAQAADEQAVARAVEALTQAMLDPDRAKLEPLCADALSYGHSAGRVENKEEFIANLLAKTAAFRTIKLSAQTITLSGNEAIVRHVLDGETESQGKVTPVHIGVLQVWQRQGGNWRLLARQAFRI